MPRWFKALLVAQVAAAAALAVLLVHLAADGAQAVGDVVQWARPHLAQQQPPAALAPSVPLPSPNATTQQQLNQLGQLSGPFLNRLDQDAATTATGELHLIAALEAMLRDRIDRALTVPTRGR